MSIQIRVSVERELCCSSGQCVQTAPGVFEQSDEDGLVRVVREQPDGADAADVHLAADLCPGRAITVVELGR